MKDWKTTTFGVGMILTALGGLLVAVSKGTLTGDMMSGTITAILGGIGFIFAGDRKPS
jgi:uncharacterized membrane protein